jgi:23S rRNA pseudouridine2605 synthase
MNRVATFPLLQLLLHTRIYATQCHPVCKRWTTTTALQQKAIKNPCLVMMPYFDHRWGLSFIVARYYAKKAETAPLSNETADTNKNTTSSEETRGIRIAKYIALSGLASRRAAEELIQQGKVTLDGNPVDSPTVKVLPGQRVHVAGRLVRPAQPRLFLHYKKRDIVVTRTPSSENEKALFPLLEKKGLPPLQAVGTLDPSSEGLLLLTTHGHLKSELENAMKYFNTTLRVRVFQATPAKIAKLEKGVLYAGRKYAINVVNKTEKEGANIWLTITTKLNYVIVKETLKLLGMDVSRLIRTELGPFKLDGLQPGDTLELSLKNLNRISNILKDIRETTAEENATDETNNKQQDDMGKRQKYLTKHKQKIDIKKGSAKMIDKNQNKREEQRPESNEKESKQETSEQRQQNKVANLKKHVLPTKSKEKENQNTDVAQLNANNQIGNEYTTKPKNKKKQQTASQQQQPLQPQPHSQLQPQQQPSSHPSQEQQPLPPQIQPQSPLSPSQAQQTSSYLSQQQQANESIKENLPTTKG